jgi:uncharacterized protein (TIGR03083 family)
MTERDPQTWITALRVSHDRLATLVQPLGPDDVTRPSMAAEWTIAQVLSHLGSQAEIFGRILDAGLEQSDPPSPDSFPAVWEVWNSRSAPDQVADSVAASEAFVRKVEGLSPTELDGVKVAMFGMDLDATRILQMRLGELALHSWDVAAALDARATVSPDAVSLLIDTLPELAHRVGKAVGGPRRVHIVSAGPPRDLLLTVDHGVTLGTWDGGEADAVVRMPSEAFVRLVYGRLDPGHTPPVEIDGEALDLDRLRAVFPGL